MTHASESQRFERYYTALLVVHSRLVRSMTSHLVLCWRILCFCCMTFLNATGLARTLRELSSAEAIALRTEVYSGLPHARQHICLVTCTTALCVTHRSDSLLVWLGARYSHPFASIAFKLLMHCFAICLHA